MTEPALPPRQLLAQLAGHDLLSARGFVYPPTAVWPSIRGFRDEVVGARPDAVSIRSAVIGVLDVVRVFRQAGRHRRAGRDKAGSRWQEAADRGQVTKVSEVGSDFLISSDGRVIAASHDVQTADDITVEFLSGEQVPATVAASEPAADVALLNLARVPAQAVVAHLGDSDTARSETPSSLLARPTASATPSPSGT